MNDTVVRRRFIAGARCPGCGAEDRIQRLEHASGRVLMCCVACGFTKDLDEQGPVATAQAGAVVWKGPGEGTS